MTEKHRAVRRRGVRGAVGVGLVLVLAGILFSANARLAGGLDARQPQDLPHLVQAEVARADALNVEVKDLSGEVERLTDARTGMSEADIADAELLRVQAGRVAMSGPGITISLSDAPPNAPQPDWVVGDDLVVHQQDLQAVVNALWAGGAEAMTLQGQRVISTSAFRCAGNILLLHGRPYSPPYVIQAIGDPEELRGSVLRERAVQRYLEWVDAVGLGWSIAEEERLELPAYADTLDLKHAALPDGVDVFAASRP